MSTVAAKGQSNLAFLKVFEKCTNFYFETEKNTPDVLRIYQYCEKILGTLTSKSFFSVKFGVVWQRCQVCYPIGIVDDFRIT